MAYQSQPLSGQGTVICPDVSDEQGDIYPSESPELEKEFLINEEPWLKRFPSFRGFDKNVALLHSFGLKKKSVPDDDIIPESEQLGILINDTDQNEMERQSYESDELPDPYWQNTDEKLDPSIFGQNGNIPSSNVLVNDSAPAFLIDEELPVIHPLNEESKGVTEDPTNFCLESFDENNSSREVRWRKEDDKDLYLSYRILWRQSFLNLKDVISTPLQKNKTHKKLMIEVAKKVGWKGKLSMLVRRLKKILNNNNLSVREKQTLTRMYKKQAKDGSLDWEQILYEFPGKTLIYLKEFWKDIKVKVEPDLPAIRTTNFDFEEDIARLKKGRLKIKEKESIDGYLSS